MVCRISEESKVGDDGREGREGDGKSKFGCERRSEVSKGTSGRGRRGGRTKRLNGVLGVEKSVEVLLDVLGVEEGCKEGSRSGVVRERGIEPDSQPLISVRITPHRSSIVLILARS